MWYNILLHTNRGDKISLGICNLSGDAGAVNVLREEMAQKMVLGQLHISTCTHFCSSRGHVLVFAAHIDMYLCLYFLHTLLAIVLLHWRNVLSNFRLLNGKWRVSLVGEKNNEVDTCDLEAELSARSAHFCRLGCSGKTLATSALFWQKFQILYRNYS